MGELSRVLYNIYIICYNQTMEFEEWINDKFLEWRGNTRKGVTEFSEFIGVSQQTMNGWLNNHVIPKSHKNINQLYEKYGYEIYDILGLPRPYPPLIEGLTGYYFSARIPSGNENQQKIDFQEIAEVIQNIEDPQERHHTILDLADKKGYQHYRYSEKVDDDVPSEILSDPDFSYVAHQWHKLSPENKHIILQQIKKATNGEITETAQEAVSAVKKQ